MLRSLFKRERVLFSGNKISQQIKAKIRGFKNIGDLENFCRINHFVLTETANMNVLVDQLLYLNLERNQPVFQNSFFVSFTLQVAKTKPENLGNYFFLVSQQKGLSKEIWLVMLRWCNKKTE